MAPGRTPKLMKSRMRKAHSSEVTSSEPLRSQAWATLRPKAPKTSTTTKRVMIVHAGEAVGLWELSTDNPEAIAVTRARITEKPTILGSRIETIIHHALFHPE